MHKSRALFLLIVALVVVAVLVSGVCVARNWLFTPLVTVTMYNATKQPVEVSVVQEGVTIDVSTLKSGHKHTVRFDPAGESSYHVSVDDGNRTMTGAAQYVESGYRIKETITSSGVASKLYFP